MAEKEPEGEVKEGAAPAAASGGKKKTILIISGVVGLLLLIGVPVAFFAMKGKEEPQSETLAADAASHGGHGAVAEGALDEDELEEGEEPLGAILPLESFVVNLSGGRFVRLQAQIEFVGRDVPKRFYSRIVPVRDRIIQILSAKTADQILPNKGRDQLRQEIKDTINEILRKEEAKQVYFTQFVIQ
jgi:flagellar FliL protein